MNCPLRDPALIFGIFGRKINTVHPPIIPPIPVPGLHREVRLICWELSHMSAIFIFFFNSSKKFCGQFLEDSLMSTFLCLDQVLIVCWRQLHGWLSLWRNQTDLNQRSLAHLSHWKPPLPCHVLNTSNCFHLLQHSCIYSNFVHLTVFNIRSPAFMH